MKEQLLQQHYDLPVTEKAFLTLTVNYCKIVQKNKLCDSKQH